MDFFGYFASIIAIIIFIPSFISNVNTPKDLIVYQVNSEKMQYTVYKFITLFLMSCIVSLIFGIIIYFDTSENSILLVPKNISLFGVITYLVITIKLVIYGVYRVEKGVTHYFQGFFWLIPLVVYMIGDPKNVILIILSSISLVFLIVAYLRENDKFDNFLIRKFNKLFNTHKFTYTFKRNTYRTITIINSIFMLSISFASLIAFVDGAFDRVQNTIFILISASSFIVALIQIGKANQFDVYNITHDYCFISNNDPFTYYFLESHIGNVALMVPYLKLVGNDKHFELISNIADPKVVFSTELQDYLRIQNPIPLSKYY